jgi:hypothetical protein
MLTAGSARGCSARRSRAVRWVPRTSAPAGHHPGYNEGDERSSV